MTNDLRTKRMIERANQLREQALAMAKGDEQAQLLRLALAWERAADRNSRALGVEWSQRRPDPEKLRAWEIKASQLRRQAGSLADEEMRRVLLHSARWLERAVTRATSTHWRG